MSRLLLAILLGLGALAPLPAGAQQDLAALERIRSQVQGHGGRARVIVELSLAGGAHVPEGLLLSDAAVALQRQDIAAAGAQAIAGVRSRGSKVLHQYTHVPLVAMEVDAAGLAELQASGRHVRRIMEDKIHYPALYQSGPLVQADQAAALGFDGTGWTVAIIDDGADKDHPFLTGKVVSEACFVSQLPTYHCPNGKVSQIGPGAAVPFPGQDHGTHIAGIAAGNGQNAVPPPSPPMSGMAKGASIIAVDVYGASGFTFDSDLIAGLNQVYSLRSTYNIASVNLSLGDSVHHTTACDSDPLKPAIDNLRSVGIATVIAAGNDSYRNAISGPACISTAISVGSTTKSDVIASSSNAASIMSLWAPGASIKSSIVGGGYDVFSGTSMATPHVAGAWAVLKQASPTASVATILSALQASGTLITDTRTTGGVTKPRINIKDALLALGPTQPSLDSTSGSPGQTLNVTITGTGFASGATADFGPGIFVNSTTFNSSTSLTVNITIATNATPGARTVSVTNPGVGTVVLAITFTVKASSPAAVGGGAGDPLALAAFGVLLPYVTGGGTVAVLEVASPVKDNLNLQLVFFNASCARGTTVSLPATPNNIGFVDVGSRVPAGQNGLVAITGGLGPLTSPIHSRVYLFNASTGRSRVLEPIILDTAEAPNGTNIWSPLKSGAAFYAPLQTATVNTSLTLICPISTIQDGTGTVPQQAFPTGFGFPSIVPAFPPISTASNLVVTIYDANGQVLRDGAINCSCLTELSVTDIDPFYGDPSVALNGTYTEIRVDPAKQNAFTGYRSVFSVGSPLNNFFGRLSSGSRPSLGGAATTGAR